MLTLSMMAVIAFCKIGRVDVSCRVVRFWLVIVQ